MATLKNSRGKFFETHRMPRDRSFWYYLMDHIGKLQEMPDEWIATSRSWVPVRSNCPLLSQTLASLVEAVPAEWRALADNLFAGRVLAGDLNASAWTKMKAGIIEINLQYTFALNGYIATFDEYFQSFSLLLQELVSEHDPPEGDVDDIVAKLNSRLLNPWGQLTSLRPHWMDPTCIVAAGNIASATSSDRERLITRAESACESFVVAHELSHHLLGHTVSRRDKRSARRVVSEALQGAELWDSLMGLSNSQREEIEADTLAFLITANAINRKPDFSDIYTATYGSIIALVALAHVNESWVELDEAATHPGFVDRYEVIYKLVHWFSTGRQKGKSGDHPLGLLAQLSGFCAIAMHGWRQRLDPRESGEFNILSIIKYLLDQTNKIHSSVPEVSEGS